MGKLIRNGIDYSTPTVDGRLDTTSTNPVQNKVVTNALNGKQDTLTIDTTPTQGSSNPVTSDGIKTALDGKQDEITSANKLSADLVDDASATNKFVSAAEKTSIGTSETKLTGVSGSATNYIELTNGKRLYLSDTEPTGTIPDGAFWIGGTVT